eukprot:CAMPEP_0171636428 /NCGR_PEP_ID=MMETSP0990-20121206/27402_1 /TAXON_ID=483369 /ORGANISM="non described non described, Strain CCMP2098" /LENGTH=260 /DNA_ID=CAMNT_0012208553 /DNA_START=49 /DNA_END=831 /DNA_ORIENTATION=+
MARRRLAREAVLVFAAFSLHAPQYTLGCYIQGSDTGFCDRRLMEESEYRAQEMPFCGPVVNYPACVPEAKPVKPDRKFNRDGRWLNHTTSTKDQWVETTVKEMIKYRLGLEVNKTLLNKGEDEYGVKGGIEPRFHRNADCRNAFRNYFCWINFPRCDGYGQSLMTCRSSCENFFRVCGYEQDLWRCGPSKYFNGYFSEGAKVTRDYYPGQPFRDYDPGRQTCTPSIEGAANHGARPRILFSAGIAAIAAVAISIAGGFAR